MNIEMESESTQSSKSQKPFGSQETWEKHYNKMLEHLIEMALTPGFKAHTWHEVKRLEADPNGFYNGIQEQFLRKVKERQNAQTKE